MKATDYLNINTNHYSQGVYQFCLLILWVWCSVEQSTLDCCRGYFSFFFQKMLLASILAKYYLFVLALCVYMYNYYIWCCIYSCICFVLFLFCSQGSTKNQYLVTEWTSCLKITTTKSVYRANAPYGVHSGAWVV